MNNYIGIGDLVLDIYYDTKMSPLGYYPGGSVMNDLINLKRVCKKAYCGCITTSGSDWASEYILNKFEELGIDIRSIKKTTNSTKRISIIVDGTMSRNQLECPICGNSTWYSGVKLPDAKDNDYSLKSGDTGIVIIGNVKKDVLNVACKFKERGWRIALDLGYISHLRYMSADKLNELLSFQIDYLQTKPSILRFLCNKFNYNGVEELFNRLGCIYLSVTDGDRGSTLYYREPDGKLQFSNCSSMQTDVLDTTGAGDALFSILLSNIGTEGVFEKDLFEVQQSAIKFATERIGAIGALGVLDKISIPPSDCPFCGNKSILKRIKQNNKESLTEKNVMRLLERTQNALNTDAINRIQKVFTNKKGVVFTVGTGGSFAAAVYVAKLINNICINNYACAKHPRDVLIEGIDHANMVLLFSYSGRTWDIRRVYDLCKLSGKEVYVITLMDYINCRKYFNVEDVISYSGIDRVSKERGFISIARTIIPISLFTQAFYGPNVDSYDFMVNSYKRWDMFFSVLNIDWNLFKENPVIDIFSGVDTAAACADLESIITESGLGMVITHEKKDFSHGRFNSIEYHPPYAIVILNNAVGSYSSRLQQYLFDRKLPNIIEMTSDKGLILGDFDLLIGCQLFVKYLSKEMRVDFTKPEYPQEAMKLYKYTRKDLR